MADSALAAALARLPELLGAHLQLSLLALLAGLVVSLPAGVWAARRPRAERWTLGVASIVQTIPALALLAVMVPTVAWLGGVLAATFGWTIRAIGFLPAFLALALYSVLPILRNTVTGLAGVDPALVEAARAVGMTPRQRLLRVELPLALPTVVAGLRTATVWVVGMATLSTPVGAPSLGDYIFSGLQTRDYASVLVGCVAAALLALVLDQLVHLLERALARRRRRLAWAVGVVLLALYAFAAGSLVAGRRPADAARGEIAIGAKTFSEQYILAELLSLELAAATGRETRVVGSLGSTVAFDALVAGDLDVYVDYSGTLWATVMGRDTRGVGRDEVLRGVAGWLADEHGVRLVGSLGFENTYALALRRDRAAALGVATISQLAPHSPELEIGGDYEFFSRPEWRALVDVYGLAFAATRSMDSSLMYQAVASREVDVVSAFSTDGRITAYDLVLLADDRGVVPPYDAVILAGRRLAADPAALAALEVLVGTIDEATMQRANLAVDQDGRAPAAVARELRRRLLESRRAQPV